MQLLNRNIQSTKQEVNRMQNQLRNNNNNNNNNGGTSNASNRLQKIQKDLDMVRNLGQNLEHQDGIDQNIMAMLNGIVDQIRYKAQRIAMESGQLNQQNYNNNNNGRIDQDSAKQNRIDITVIQIQIQSH